MLYRLLGRFHQIRVLRTVAFLQPRALPDNFYQLIKIMYQFPTLFCQLVLHTIRWLMEME